MPDFNKRKKISFSLIRPFLPLVLVLSLMFVSIQTLVLPKITDIKQLFKSNKDQEEKLSKLTEKLTLLENIDQTDLVQHSELLLQALPESKQPMLVMGVLKQLSADSGIEIAEMSVKPGGITATSSAEKEETKKEGSQDKAQSLLFSLSTLGTYDQISEFINKLDKTLPLLRMEKLSLKRGLESGSFTVSTEIQAYFLALPKTLGKIEAPLQIASKEEKEIYDRLQQFSSPVGEESLFPTIESGRENPFL